MSETLERLEGVVCQFYDITIYDKDVIEHDKNLNKVLTRLQVKGWTLNCSKCVFRHDILSLLDHLLTKDEIKTDPFHFEAITKLKPPNNVKEIRRILGIVNHTAKVILN